MASPLQTGKKTVDLKSAAPGVSRIRREPPPPVARKTVIPDRDERDQWTVTVGILAFTCAILAIIIGFSSFSGWSPSDQVIHIRVE